MAFVLDKLKAFFVANASTLVNKKSAVLAFVKSDVDPSETWETMESIGEGSFGLIYKARHRVNGSWAALKQISISLSEEIEDHAVEIEILSQSQHKNIIKLYEAYHYNGKLWIYLEYCGGGALDSIMTELERPLSESEIRCVCKEVCEGLVYLHDNAIIHRDLKASNLLLTTDGNVKLCDFGVSAKNRSIEQRRNSSIGTPYWMAPEVIACETVKNEPYDYRADIWSLGITLIELAQMHPPNHNMNPGRVKIRIHLADSPTLDLPHKWSADFNDFLSKCLKKSPSDRATARELLRHKFLAGSVDNKELARMLSEANAEVTVKIEDIDISSENTPELSVKSSESNSTELSAGKDYRVNGNGHSVVDRNLSSEDSDPRKQDSGFTNGGESRSANSKSSSTTAIDYSKPSKRPAPSVPASSANAAKAANVANSDNSPNSANAATARVANSVETSNSAISSNTSSVSFETATSSEMSTSFLTNDVSPIISSSTNHIASVAIHDGYSKESSRRRNVELEEQTKTMIISDDDDDVGKLHSGTAGKKEGAQEKKYSSAEGVQTNGKNVPVIFSGMAAKRLLQSHPGGKRGRELEGGGEENGEQFDRQKSHYRSLTKTRTYVYNGQAITSQTSKVVLQGEENRSREDLDRRRANDRRQKMLKMNRRRLEVELNQRFAAEHDQLEREFDLRSQELLKSCAAEAERLSRAQKVEMDKLESVHTQQFRATSRGIKAQQEQDLKVFQENQRREFQQIKRECENVPRNVRKDILTRRIEEKEVQHIEKKRKFLEQQKEILDRDLHQLMTQHREETFKREKFFLAEKHDLQLTGERKLWKLDEQHIQNKSKLSIKQIHVRYDLLLQLTDNENAVEVDIIKQNFDQEESALLRRQAAERKLFIKKLKEKSRSRMARFREEQRSRPGLTAESEREKVREFEEKELRQYQKELEVYDVTVRSAREELTSKYRLALSEQDQVHRSKLEEYSRLKNGDLADEDERLKRTVGKWKQELRERRKVLDEEFKREERELDSFYSRGTEGARRTHPSQSLNDLHSQPPRSSNNGRHHGNGATKGVPATWTVDSHMSTAF